MSISVRSVLPLRRGIPGMNPNCGIDPEATPKTERSSRVSLASHVRHTITATGVVSHAKMHNMKEGAKDMGKDSGLKKDVSEHGHMTITRAKMVSDSCGE